MCQQMLEAHYVLLLTNHRSCLLCRHKHHLGLCPARIHKMDRFATGAWYNECVLDASAAVSSRSDAKTVSVLFSNPDVEDLILLPSLLI